MQNRKEKVHMNYEEFKVRFIEEVKEKLAEQGYDMNVSVNEVKKFNETYDEGRPLSSILHQASDGECDLQPA